LAASFFFSIASTVQAQDHPERQAIEGYAEETAKWGLEFNCIEARQQGKYIGDDGIPKDEELAYAVAEGYCAGFVTGIVQLISNIASGDTSISDVDVDCMNLPDGFYRIVADGLEDVDVIGSRPSARVVFLLERNFPCN